MNLNSAQTLCFKADQLKHIEVINYPDGQHSVRLDTSFFNLPTDRLVLKVRLRAFKELELFAGVVSALRHLGYPVKHVEFLYLFGLRSDRVFKEGEPNYFRDVVAPYINMMQFKEIKLVDPHGVGDQYLNAQNIYYSVPFASELSNHTLVLGADRHSLHTRLHFEKKREGDSVQVWLAKEIHQKINEAEPHLPIVIADDLCDGGATFIAIANYLRLNFPKRERILYLTHGLFTKGITALLDAYKYVFVTNSYQDFPSHTNPRLRVKDVWTL